MPTDRLRLGLNLGPIDPRDPRVLEAAVVADRLGYGSIWTAESYGADAVSALAFVAAKTSGADIGTAVMQMSARVPTVTAMTAATLDHLSGGRMRLGLGLSGPALVEGWHGTAYGKPLGKTKEYVEIVRQVLARRPVDHHREHYDIPYGGPGATGAGRPIKLIVPPPRADMPVYLGAIGPRNVELATRIADGWLAVFCSPGRVLDVWGEAIADAPDGFDVAATVPVVVGDDVDSCRQQVKPRLALYMGGMGTKQRNFYNSLAQRYGYEAAARRVQDLFLAGDHAGAAAAVPDELVDEVSLCGPAGRIAERLEAWRASPVTTLLAGTTDLTAIETLAGLIL